MRQDFAAAAKGFRVVTTWTKGTSVVVTAGVPKNSSLVTSPLASTRVLYQVICREFGFAKRRPC